MTFGFFHLLATGNSASINMNVQISLRYPGFNSFEYPEVELLDHVAVSFLIFFFLGNSFFKCSIS